VWDGIFRKSDEHMNGPENGQLVKERGWLGTFGKKDRKTWAPKMSQTPYLYFLGDWGAGWGERLYRDWVRGWGGG